MQVTYLNCPLCGYSVKRGELGDEAVGTVHCPRCTHHGLSIALVEARFPGQTLDEDSVAEWPRVRDD